MIKVINGKEGEKMEEIKEAAEELRRRPIFTECLKVAKKGYECVGCGNGSGDSGTGAILSEDGTRLLCGKCQRGFTNIDVLAKYLGLETTGTDFVEVVKYGMRKIGLETTNFQNFVSSVKPKAKEEINKLIVSDVEKGRENKVPVKENRGLSEETLEKFKVGVIKDWTPPKSRLKDSVGKVTKEKYPTERIIIPHLENSSLPTIPLTYCAGLLMSERERLESQGKEYVKYLYGGERTPFGLNTLREKAEKVFVTEGEWDALSIWEAMRGKYPCLATGGTAENGTLSALQKFYPDKKPSIYFVGDNDKAGEEFSEGFCDKARHLGFKAIPMYFGDIGGEKVDANKILMLEGKIALEEKLFFQISQAEIELEEVERHEKKEVMGEDAAEYFEEEFEEYMEFNKKFAGRKTGFGNLDTEMRIFRPGVYVLGGLAALGKTTFALQLLEQLSRRGENCIYCSYEMEKGFLYSKMLSREVFRLESQNYSREVKTPLTAVQISQGEFEDHEENYKKAVKNFIDSKISLRIWELDEVKIDILIERLEKICTMVEKPPIVCIDYLQLLASGNENTKNALDEALRKIFNFRRKTNTTFIIISSLNRMNYNTEISYESFKETGTIEYSADVIWGLQLLLSERTASSVEVAKKEIPRKIQLKCLKNRFGSNYDVGFFYYPNVDYFKEMEEYGEYKDYRINESGQKVEISRSRKKKSY